MLVLKNSPYLLNDPRTCFRNFGSVESRFNPFDSVSLAILRFEISWSQKRMTWKNFFCRLSKQCSIIKPRVVFSARNCKRDVPWAPASSFHASAYYSKYNERFDLIFCKKFCKVILFWCHENSQCRVANGTESNGLNLCSRIREIVKHCPK